MAKKKAASDVSTKKPSLKPPKKSIKRYSKEDFIIAASKYTSKSEFKKHDKNAYEAAQKRGLLPEIYNTIGLINQNKDWTQETVLAVARNCKNATEFSIDHAGAYGWAKRNGLLETLASCYRVPSVKKVYSEDEVRKLASSCNQLNTFNRMDQGRVARRARKLGIHKEITCHMIPSTPKTKTKYAVYALVNEPLKKVYVGVTNRPILERIARHKEPNNTCRSSALMHEPGTNWIQATDYRFTNAQVRNQEVEKRLADSFEADGYEVVNDPNSYGKCGGGQPSKYTTTSLALEAQRFKTRSAFKKHSGGAYRAAQRKGPAVFKEVTAHMPNPRPKHWKHVGKSKVVNEVKKLKEDGCKTRSALYRNSQSLYHRVNTLGLMDDLLPRKTSQTRSNNELLEAAKRYQSAEELRNKNPRLYKLLSKRGLLKEAFKKK